MGRMLIYVLQKQICYYGERSYLTVYKKTLEYMNKKEKNLIWHVYQTIM